jgi:thiol-disulfide isomerase/thioredoxin
MLPTSTAWTTRFPSLAPIFAAKPALVGLLFATSWCPDCWPVVPRIKGLVKAFDGTADLSIVYISSDDTAEQMASYKPAVLAEIPFANVEERSDLKRLTKTCARKEMTAVGMTSREHGTPTLILLNAETGATLTADGVKDVMELAPVDVLAKWKALL